VPEFYSTCVRALEALIDSKSLRWLIQRPQQVCGFFFGDEDIVVALGYEPYAVWSSVRHKKFIRMGGQTPEVAASAGLEWLAPPSVKNVGDIARAVEHHARFYSKNFDAVRDWLAAQPIPDQRTQGLPTMVPFEWDPAIR